MRKIAILLVCILMFVLVGCKPKEDPTVFINSYYQNIKDSNFEAAYDKLSAESQKNIIKEDFITWQTLALEVQQLKDDKLEKSSEEKNKTIDGIKYKNSIEYTITEKITDFYSNKEITNNYKRNVVEENGKWKLYRGKENGKEIIANMYYLAGSMYADGKGKDKDLNQAATDFSNGLGYDKDYFNLYLGLGTVYFGLQRYDDSIKAIDSYLAKETKNESKSDAYNIKGLDYEGLNSVDKAKEMLNKALELNPNNEFAKTNLASLK